MKTTLKRASGRTTANGSGNGAGVLPPAPLTEVTRYGPRTRSPLRKVGRFFGWLVVLLFVLGGGAAGGWLLYLNEEFAGTRAHSPQARAAEAILDEVPPADEPAVALVIGYDSRRGADKGNPARSDTLILVRADPRLKTISLLSLPRDLVVDLPACGGLPARQDRINSVFTECGMKGTVEAVRSFTDVPINYMIAVDFVGFMDIVDALGGVYLDVDRRYFNDNAGLGPGETYARIDLRSGYQRLHGRDALGFVRYRHTDSDLYRNARQQEFVKAFKQQVSSLWSVTKLRGIVHAVTENVEVGVGGGGTLDFQTMLSYARLAYDVPAGNIHQVRLGPLAENSAYELFADEAQVEEAVGKLMTPDVQAAEKAANAATGGKRRPEAAVVPPASVSVEVLNGNGLAGAADDATFLLGRRGYQATNGGNADRLNYFRTRVLYDPTVEDADAAATQLADLFGEAEVDEALTADGLTTTLRVVVGQTFKGRLVPGPRDETPAHTPPAVVRDPALASEVARVRRKVDFQLLVPTVREESSTLAEDDPVRVYRVRGKSALKVTFNGPEGTEYWGIQQTSWTDPPLLAGPSTTRTIGGREYRLFFNGPHLHVVAFEENGAAYWVTNSLLDSLSNETMLAVAKGLKPPSR
jgi:LCP family protein required for cell wall assembly